jgi:ArsR family transcriptional regulator, arsenate/arsenite/antimonite-responsive transcriptional repressor
MSTTAATTTKERELALPAKAVGYPMRVRLLRILRAQERCFCKQLVAELPLAQPTVSQHLKVLKEAGLVTGQIEGARVCYCASRERLNGLHDLVCDLLLDAVEVTGRGCD